MKRIVPVAIAVIYDKQSRKLLLTKRREVDREDKDFGHCWNFPGGGVEWGEDPVTALHREAKEELGIELNVERIFPEILSPVRGKWHGLLICYLCTMKKPGQQILLNHESLDFGWYDLEEIRRLKLLPLGLEIARLSYTLF